MKDKELSREELLLDLNDAFAMAIETVARQDTKDRLDQALKQIKKIIMLHPVPRMMFKADGSIEVRPQTEEEQEVAVGEVLFGKEEHEKQMAKVALDEFVEKWANKMGADIRTGREEFYEAMLEEYDKMKGER